MSKMALIFSVLIIVSLAGCINSATTETKVDTTEVSEGSWRDIPLKDVRTGKTFKISDFKGKPILLESFAVWCPTCTAQQRRTKELATSEGDKIIHISLDTDPNEDEEIIREHVETNGFNWYYAVSPIELTRALIDEFDVKIVNAPGVPMILICEDQSTRFLKRGIKSPEDLLSEVNQGC